MEKEDVSTLFSVKVLKINFQRLFYSSGRMAELFLQMYQIPLVMLVVF